MNALCIETSTEVCSVALARDGVCVASKISNDDKPSHAALLSVFVQEILDKAKQENIKIDAVAVSCGPGSYTGLRIGVSTAKGLCYGLEAKLLAVNTLELMALAVKQSHCLDENTLLCPMIDARRMEVYTAFFDKDLKNIRPTSADIIDENSYSDLLKEHKILFFGNGAAKCRSTLTHENAIFVENIFPLAENMISLSERAFAENRFEDVAYFEPFYLKEFVTTTPKNKIFN